MEISFNATARVTQSIELTDAYKHLTTSELADNLESGEYLTTLGHGDDALIVHYAINDDNQLETRTVATIVSQDIDDADYEEFEVDDE